jgi:hypothetical protein
MGMAIPKIKPHETYVYLGIHVSLTLQWHANSKSLTARVLARLAAIRTMRHDPALVLRTLEMVVRPMIRYVMPLATLSWADVKRLNSAVWATAKYIVGLSRHSSNMHVMRPLEELGMGIDPLHLTLIDTLRQTVETLRNSSQDLGRMWAGIWERHTTGMAAIGLAAHADSARTAYPTLNAVAQLADMDIVWTNDDYVPPPTRPNSILTIVEIAFRELKLSRKRTPLLRALNPLWVAGIHDVEQLQRHNSQLIMTVSDTFLRHPTWKTPAITKALRKLHVWLQVDTTGRMPEHLRPPPFRQPRPRSLSRRAPQREPRSKSGRRTVL